MRDRDPIYTQGIFRIVEISDDMYNIEDLKEDVYKPEVNKEILPEVLKRQERNFERLVQRVGVFGYALEKWNPEVGKGWETIDSCWGFVGKYSKDLTDYNHYIVDEMKQTITKLEGKT